MHLAWLVFAVIVVGCSGSSSPSRPVTSNGAALATAPQAPSGAADNPPECPPSPPADRSSCPRYLVQCAYPGESRCPHARCADVASQLVWLTTVDHCAIDCPATKPAAGSACSPITSRGCTYKGGEKCGFVMTCRANGWSEEELTLCDGM